MIEIKFTLDTTPALIGAVRDLAGAIHAAANNAQPVPAGEPGERLTTRAAPVDAPVAPEKDGIAEQPSNLPADAPAEAERPETPEYVEEPKKRKSRAKKAPSESNTPVAPASGDNLSADGANAEPGQSAPEETHALAPVVEDPVPVEGAVSFACVSYVGARISETPATDPAPAEEAPEAPADDPLAGKGKTGEVLTELTRKAIGELDAAGVDRSDANRRIRAYCARTDIKFPTFPALLQAVGYAEAMAICKGSRV